MEKYCTIAIFMWLGLPLFIRGVVFLEIDASQNIDGVSTNFEIPDDHRDYTSANLINNDGQELIKTESTNSEGIFHDKDDVIVSPSIENLYDYGDHTSANPINGSVHELIRTETPNIEEGFHDKDEVIVSPDFENRYEYRLENLIIGGDDKMIQSDPVMDEIPDDIELVYQLNKKRHVPDHGFTEETKKQMLDLHNVYRGNVTPPAADMNFLEWDKSLEHSAQLWADNCVFAHGRPPNATYYFEGKIKPYGQNLYIGTDPSGYKGLWMWYEEYLHYELRSQICKPDEQCGHYVQMAWAESKRLGCGIKLCGRRYLIVCHYYPGAIKDVQMFRVGRPCSQCDEEEGALCKGKLCVSHELCKRRPQLCESATCNLKCQNCGRLDKTACKCACADGWDSPDCSKPCADEHERCGRKPGFPHKASCSIQNYSVAKKYCRKMCDTCVSVSNDTTVSHLCCEGRLCEKGYVLDLERKPCRCTLLCPGPLCDFIDDDASALKYNIVYLTSLILMLYFVNLTNHSL